jgi:hypothetical protein
MAKNPLCGAEIQSLYFKINGLNGKRLFNSGEFIPELNNKLWRRRRGIYMCPQLPWALWWGESALGTFKSALQVSTVVEGSSKAVVKNSREVVCAIRILFKRVLINYSLNSRPKALRSVM